MKFLGCFLSWLCIFFKSLLMLWHFLFYMQLNYECTTTCLYLCDFQTIIIVIFLFLCYFSYLPVFCKVICRLFENQHNVPEAMNHLLKQANHTLVTLSKNGYTTSCFSIAADTYAWSRLSPFVFLNSSRYWFNVSIRPSNIFTEFDGKLALWCAKLVSLIPWYLLNLKYGHSSILLRVWAKRGSLKAVSGFSLNFLNN